jgi:hypothetical protein
MMLHPDLQKLLDFALESGEVTEKHRQILHNKAISLNQDIDELEMIIEGEIKRLKKVTKAKSKKIMRVLIVALQYQVLQ